MSMFKSKPSSQPEKIHEDSRKEYERLIFIRQSSWYALGFIIFLFCTLIGLGLGYFVIRILAILN